MRPSAGFGGADYGGFAVFWVCAAGSERPQEPGADYGEAGGEPTGGFGGGLRVLTMDLHALNLGQIQGFFDIPVDHLYANDCLWLRC